MAELFWLSEAQMARLRPLLPNKPRGVPRVDDRRVISGIVQVLIRNHIKRAVMVGFKNVSASARAPGQWKWPRKRCPTLTAQRSR